MHRQKIKIKHANYHYTVRLFIIIVENDVMGELIRDTDVGYRYSSMIACKFATMNYYNKLKINNWELLHLFTGEKTSKHNFT